MASRRKPFGIFYDSMWPVCRNCKDHFAYHVAKRRTGDTSGGPAAKQEEVRARLQYCMMAGMDASLVGCGRSTSVAHRDHTWVPGCAVCAMVAGQVPPMDYTKEVTRSLLEGLLNGTDGPVVNTSTNTVHNANVSRKRRANSSSSRRRNSLGESLSESEYESDEDFVPSRSKRQALKARSPRRRRRVVMAATGSDSSDTEGIATPMHRNSVASLEEVEDVLNLRPRIVLSHSHSQVAPPFHDMGGMTTTQPGGYVLNDNGAGTSTAYLTLMMPPSTAPVNMSLPLPPISGMDAMNAVHPFNPSSAVNAAAPAPASMSLAHYASLPIQLSPAAAAALSSVPLPPRPVAMPAAPMELPGDNLLLQPDEEELPVPLPFLESDLFISHEPEVYSSLEDAFFGDLTQELQPPVM